MEAANTLFGKVIDLVFIAAKREIDYVRNFTENVDKLRHEVEKLNEMKDMVQQQIDVAKGRGDRILAGVQNWIEKADAEMSTTGKLLDEEANAKKTCFNSRICINLGTRHRYSKMATRKTRLLLQIHEDGKTYESCVSIPAPTPSIVDLYERKNLDDIDSHKLTLGKIITALADESIQIVGIHGVGGIGKTTLAKEVAAEVKNQYADIVFITVSQTVNHKMIQDKVEVAAKRIINGDKVLIILDDIWEDLQLSEVGIPCGSGHMNCKILLTSRSKNVCEAMNVQSNICVSTLTKKEAWILFRRVVGERLETDNRLKKIATEVVQECGGLPLIIQVLGRTLRSMATHLWEGVLDRLQNHAPPGNIAPELRKAYTHLKLSYDYLESDEAKACFLLCSLFPEDEKIPLTKLVEYGVGVGIFNNLDSIQDARNRVQIALDALQSACLLLTTEFYYEHTVRMHDVVRDVALSIASNGKDNFLVKAGKGLTEWKLTKNTSESYTKISLWSNKIHELPDHEFHFPLLDTFIIGYNSLSVIPDEFFRGTREVKVLDLSSNYISLFPQSLKLLTKLRMLNLSYNRDLKEISILGELKDLEILMLGNTGIEQIPEEIGQLTSLRLLNIESCKALSHITPGVISRLTRLEELYIADKWGGDMDQLCLAELIQLKSFKTLHLKVLNLGFFSQGTAADLENLTGFHIQIATVRTYVIVKRKSHIQRSLVFLDHEMALAFTGQVKKLIQVSECITLFRIKDIDSILPGVYEESFNNDLKSIRLLYCANVSCLVKTIGERKTKEKYFAQVGDIILDHLGRLELLWDCPHQYISFGSLQTIEICACRSLLRLFPLTVAQGLVNLTDIQIEDCGRLVEVISASDENSSGHVEIEETDAEEDIVFPSLTKISLIRLSRLESFYSGHSTVKYPSLKSIYVRECPRMKTWAYGVHDIPNINHQGTHWPINDFIAHVASHSIDIKFVDRQGYAELDEKKVVARRIKQVSLALTIQPTQEE